MERCVACLRGCAASRDNVMFRGLDDAFGKEGQEGENNSKQAQLSSLVNDVESVLEFAQLCSLSSVFLDQWNAERDRSAYS